MDIKLEFWGSFPMMCEYIDVTCFILSENATLINEGSIFFNVPSNPEQEQVFALDPSVYKSDHFFGK